MFLFAAVIIAFTSNLDNLGVGLSFGMRSIRISPVPNLIIASITMLGTGLAMFLGGTIARLIPGSAINMLGGLVIIAIGALAILNAFRTLHPAAQVVGSSKANWLGLALGVFENKNLEYLEAISTREAVLLGIALSCNNVATGIAAGASGVSLIATTILSGMFSFVCVASGSQLGATTGTRLLGRFAPLLAGIMLVGVGVVLAAG